MNTALPCQTQGILTKWRILQEEVSNKVAQFSSCFSVCQSHLCDISGIPGMEEENDGYPAEQVISQWQEVFQDKRRVFQEVFLAQPILDPNMNVTWDQDLDQGQVRKTQFHFTYFSNTEKHPNTSFESPIYIQLKPPQMRISHTQSGPLNLDNHFVFLRLSVILHTIKKKIFECL